MKNSSGEVINNRMRVVLVALVPLFAVAGVKRIESDLFHSLPPSQKLIGSSALFFVIAISMLTLVTGCRLFSAPRAKDVCGIAVGVLAYAALLQALGRSSFLLRTTGLAIFLAATSEELVYRVALPRAVDASASPSRDAPIVSLGAVLASQLLFAVSHLAPAGSAGAPSMLLDAYRLLVAGLLYAIVVHAVGAWIAAAVHGALNVDQFFVTGQDNVSAGLVTVVALGSLPFVLHAFRSKPLPTISRRHNASR